ncbi:MAG TPA: hypothetical protein DCR97_04430 [Deltaproteobacteria bacterium]|nr:hypothetical protein [Deltaproteobacteria bacterium]
MRYVDDVRYALMQLGGEGCFEDICRLVRDYRAERRETLSLLGEWVQSTLQQNSRGIGRDIFELALVEEGKSTWKLK